MKRMISMVFLGLLLVLMGCSKSVDIDWEGVTITVNEYARMPQEFQTGNRPTYVVAYTVSGNPPDNFLGYDSLGLIEVYDETGQMCSSFAPISGGQDDVLVKDTIEVVASNTCSNPTSKVQFIFRASNTELLDYVGEKKTFSVKEQPSERVAAILSDWNQKRQQEAEERREAAEEQARLQAEKEVKIQELQESYDAKLQECLYSDAAMQACLSSSNLYVDAINAIRENYNACLANPKPSICYPGFDEIVEDTGERIEKEDGIYIVYRLKPNHNGETILNNLIAQETEKQEDICTRYDIKDYCIKTVKEELCVGNEYCAYLETKCSEGLSIATCTAS